MGVGGAGLFSGETSGWVYIASRERTRIGGVGVIDDQRTWLQVVGKSMEVFLDGSVVCSTGILLLNHVT